MASDSALRQYATRRIVATGETVEEAVFGNLHEPLFVRADLPAGLFRFRIAPTGALVIGTPDGKPERVKDSR